MTTPSRDPANLTRLHVNGELRDVRGGSLAELLSELGFAGVKVATAINGEFVPERARPASPVRDGDRIEILSARQGG
ncbi:MAG: sulfur carrier protein ThiS [Hyphomicrobiaceae bacterium]